MENGSKFYMVKKKALPEILLKVAEANVLLKIGKAKTIKRRLMPLESAGVLITNIKMTFSSFMKRFRERQLPL